ncbi:hypothetical protein SAMN04244579_03113 [Azotobacter beijerinckii]|uniref:Uncharacterized protein n=1 Tax=Azotobacter beijerinckii TaxID=170623 RepID=A0A1H6WC22_9GAMM|nr:hypothetical protein [Azotobacter beijerinckii]SEJ09865.1 hypothetical protein SAMN04244579_03113 [Azotobacter beijerinckii]
MTRAKLQAAERPVFELPRIELGISEITDVRRARAALEMLVHSEPGGTVRKRAKAAWTRRQERLVLMLIGRLDRMDRRTGEKRRRFYAMARMDAALDRMHATLAVEDRAKHRRWAVRWAHAAMVS